MKICFVYGEGTMTKWYLDRVEKAISELVGGGAMLEEVLEALYAILEKVGEYIEGIEQDIERAEEQAEAMKEKEKWHD